MTFLMAVITVSLIADILTGVWAHMTFPSEVSLMGVVETLVGAIIIIYISVKFAWIRAVIGIYALVIECWRTYIAAHTAKNSAAGFTTAYLAVRLSCVSSD